MPGPDISVVIPSYNARATIERCLDALREQDFDGSYEVVVVDSSEDGTAALVAERFPEVAVVAAGTRRYPGDARNAGVAASRGAILAFTDADCVPAPDWLARIAAAHAAGHELVGGSLAPPPSGAVRRAYHLAAFAPWLDDGRARSTAQVATGCLSVSRAVLEECGPFRQGTLGSDSGFSWEAARRGYTPFFDPSIRVVHLAGELPLRTLVARRFANGRAFASLRVRDQPFDTARTLAYTALAPLLPGVLFARVVRRVLAARRDRIALLRLAPLVLLLVTAWSLGEAAGYAGSLRRGRRAATPVPTHG